MTVSQYQDLSSNVVSFIYDKFSILYFYRYSKGNLFIGLKLEAHFLTIATAATLYHRFMKEATAQGYDNYVSYLIN